MMINLIGDALSWLLDMLASFFLTVLNFFISPLPAPDMSFYADIEGFFSDWSGTINPLAFVDWSLVMNLFLIGFGVFSVACIYRMVVFVIGIIHKVSDSIPIVG